LAARSKVPFPQASFNSTARGSAAKHWNSCFHQRHCRSLLSLPPLPVGHFPAAQQKTAATSRKDTLTPAASSAMTLTAALLK